MYEKINSGFKNKLKDRKLFFKISIIATVSLFVFAVFEILAMFYSLNGIWFFTGALCWFLIFAGSVYIIIFDALKEPAGFTCKDIIHGKRFWKALKIPQPKDVQILVPILKETGVNTRPKVQEAIRHYQMLLLRKPFKGVDMIPLISLVVSICAIVLSGITYGSYADLVALIVLLSTIILMLVAFYIICKLFYKTLYYDLSEYALYERIEIALSEIWMKQLI